MFQSKLLPNRGKILALDPGTNRTGLAISDASQQVSFIRDAIEHPDLETQVSLIHQVLSSENCVGLVMGYPVNMQGNATKQTAYVDDLIQHLNIPIFKMDERRTSIEANQIKQHKMKSIDSESAYILLNNYIDLKNKQV